MGSYDVTVDDKDLVNECIRLKQSNQHYQSDIQVQARMIREFRGQAVDDAALLREQVAMVERLQAKIALFNALMFDRGLSTSWGIYAQEHGDERHKQS